jgi:hypothetical protein
LPAYKGQKQAAPRFGVLPGQDFEFPLKVLEAQGNRQTFGILAQDLAQILVPANGHRREDGEGSKVHSEAPVDKYGRLDMGVKPTSSLKAERKTNQRKACEEQQSGKPSGEKIVA